MIAINNFNRLARRGSKNMPITVELGAWYREARRIMVRIHVDPAHILEVSKNLFFFGIHRNDRLVTSQKAFHTTIRASLSG